MSLYTKGGPSSSIDSKVRICRKLYIKGRQVGVCTDREGHEGVCIVR